MCGIVGYLGHKNAVNIVLEGLRRLEYRGYDSAGICLKSADGQLTSHKRTGKLINLVDAIKDMDLSSDICIGHTRWASLVY